MLVALFDGVLAESADEGATWRHAAVESSVGRLTELRDDRSGGVVAIGLDGTLERSPQGTWREMPGLEPGEQVWFAPGHRARRFATHEGDWVKGAGGRLRATADGGTTWVDLPLPGGRGTSRLAVVDSKGDTLFASPRGLAPRRLWNSQDGGRTWRDVADCHAKVLQACDVVPDPADPRTLYLLQRGVGIGGGGDLLERTIDGGRTWTPIHLKSLVFQTAVLPTSPTTLVVLAYDTADYRHYALLASRDRGDTWARIGHGLPNDVTVAVVGDPARPQVLFAATQGRGIFRSADGGRTWIRTSRLSSSRQSPRPPSAAR